MKIAITPIQIWSKSGVATATHFEVRHITYHPGGGAVADTHLLSETIAEVDGESVTSYPEVGSGSTVEIPQVTCDTWADDADFLAAIAAQVGLTPSV